MTNRDEVIRFLSTISPRTASNADIVSHTGIKPHQQVFQITKSLMKEGRIKGRRAGREWHFFIGDDPTSSSIMSSERQGKIEASNRTGKMTPLAFEQLCREVMSNKYGTLLRSATVDGVRKQFDLVSADESIVGDAKYYTAVKGTGLPPAKFATIAEYVWLLEKTSATRRFLVFGNDRRVPEWWLERYGGLLQGVDFYYLSDDGKLELLS